MIYGSVCSGIEAATAAWHPLGWKAAWFAEIEKFPSAVLKHHYPQVPNYGDFTRLRDDPTRPAIDLLVGGTPCQSFSISGLRAGLDDDRGNLALEFLRLAGAARPRWILFENVPGLLSSTSHAAPDSRPPGVGVDGYPEPEVGEKRVVVDEYVSDERHAFACFVAGLQELGYGVAWRVLDAQFFGVAQRRNRVFVVGCLGNWAAAAAVLFERSSMRGDPAPRRASREDVASTIGSSSSDSGWSSDLDRSGAFIPETVPTLTASHDASPGGPGDSGFPIVCTEVTPIAEVDGRFSEGTNKDGIGIGAPGDPIFTVLASKQHGVFISNAEGSEEINLTASCGVKGVNNQTPLVAFDLVQITSKTNRSNPAPGDPAPTISKNSKMVASSFDWRKGSDPTSSMPLEDDSTGTLGSSHQPHAVCFSIVPEGGQGADLRASQVDTSPALTATDGAKTTDGGVRIALEHSVRRLTPTEYEHLFGFPAGYTKISPETKDGPRYKALGNSMAVVVMAWLGRRIDAVDQIVFGGRR